MAVTKGGRTTRLIPELEHAVAQESLHARSLARLSSSPAHPDHSDARRERAVPAAPAARLMVDQDIAAPSSPDQVCADQDGAHHDSAPGRHGQALTLHPARLDQLDPFPANMSLVPAATVAGGSIAPGSARWAAGVFVPSAQRTFASRAASGATTPVGPVPTRTVYGAEAPPLRWTGSGPPAPSETPDLESAQREQDSADEPWLSHLDESAPAETTDAVMPRTAAPDTVAPETPAPSLSPSPTPSQPTAIEPAIDQSFCARVHEHVLASVGAERAAYLRPRASIRPAGRGVEVVASDASAAEMLKRRFGAVFERAVQVCCAATGQSGVTLSYVAAGTPTSTRPGEPGSADGATSSPLASTAIAPKPSRSAHASHEHSDARRASRQPHAQGLRYRLDDFVVGQSNRFAFTMAQELAEGGRQSKFGALFLHGGCGLGKTHLLQGVAHRFAQRHPGALVRYTTGEAFTNEFIGAIKSNRIETFRRTHRRLDLLCIDDVHFVANKEATQNELLHTFDSIGLDGARIIFASDESPRQIANLSQQLVSRLIASLVVALDPPELDLRTEIVQRFARRRGLPMDFAATRFIAERSGRSLGPMGLARGFGGSVRDIEGMLTQVEAVYKLLPELASAEGGQIGLLLVRKALGLGETEAGPGMAGAHPNNGRVRRPIQMATIIAEVCRVTRVDIADFNGRGRHKRVVLARGLSVVLARQLTAFSYPEIARAMNRPNHSSVLTAHQRLTEQMGSSDAAWVAEQIGPEFMGVSLNDLVERLARDIVRASD
ncbi:MAG: DnaA/Hda family protein [Planctomycetota bacterium]|nr:DnaA/Hda family protein [Planctomycetota bacterium]